MYLFQVKEQNKSLKKKKKLMKQIIYHVEFKALVIEH